MRPQTRLPAFLALAVTAVLVWSGINPHDRFTWWLEVAPVLVVLPLLAFTFARFPLTPLVYLFVFLHACILMVGGHYTYALAPAGDALRDLLALDRNPYDRVGHFAQGFVPALVIRELLIRTSPLKSGKWLFAIILFGCLGISATYEILEWAAAMMTGDKAEAFLGTQGDVWDTQADMALAGLGACAALLLLGRLHDRHLKSNKFI